MTEQPGLVNSEMEKWLHETLPKIEEVSGVQAFDLVYGTFTSQSGAMASTRAAL